MALGLLLAAVVVAAPVTVDDLPVGIEPAKGWTAKVRGAGSLTLSRASPPVEFMIDFEPGIQPDLESTDVEAMRAMLTSELQGAASDVALSELEVRRIDHAVLGPVFEATATGRVEGVPIPVRMRFALFAGPAGTAMVAGGIYAAPDRAAELFTQALDQLVWVDEPIARDDFSWGKATFDDFTLDLPDGWRAAHRQERRNLGIESGQEMVLDPAGIDDVDSFGCVTNEGPLEVVDPELSELHAKNFRVRSRAHLSGGGYVSRGGGGASRTKVTLSGAPVKVDPEERGTLELVELGDRDGYLWRVGGTVVDEPVQVAMIYTTWGGNSVDCVFIGPEVPDGIVDSLRSLRVTSDRPPYETLRGQYVKAWPFRHPLLQAWWFGGLILLAAAVWAVRLLK